MDSLELNPQESTILTEQSLPNSRDSENIGDSFSQQLLEIDKDIGFNENPLISALGADSRKAKSACASSDREEEVVDDSHLMSRAPTLVTPLPQVSSIPLQDISNSVNISGVTDKSTQPT